MSDIVRYSTASVPNPVIEYRQSVNTPDYSNQPNVLINPDLSLLSGIPIQYWKHVSGSIQQMTQAEKDAVDAASSTSLTNSNRVTSKNIMISIDGLGVLQRTIASIIKDEINILRQRDRDRAVDVSNATSLADLKIRWAAQSTLADRTLSQVKTAINNTIDSGVADS